MKMLKTFVLFCAVCLSLGGSLALADQRDYTESDFNKTLQSGATVVLDFHANWCPTCRAQSKAFETLLKEDKLAGLTLYKVDYDKSDDLKKKYGVMKQSTLVLFKDQKEIDRSMGVTDVDALRTFLSKGL
jgi:thioredoxin 1